MTPVKSGKLVVPCGKGDYSITFFNTTDRELAPVAKAKAHCAHGVITTRHPAFAGDVAAEVRPA